ncbi:hypothetical protein F0L74_24665 [Chitinophaga agrisoli]|uniref:Uncharacterized protein n=1 Tax=Chitinophaga agrisoli TaxID=2607653 RepID=A0A5B2VL13_9BACT|nr:hypothetical protein F0L74_24665 [Chitinophaga agrisoli]
MAVGCAYNVPAISVTVAAAGVAAGVTGAATRAGAGAAGTAGAGAACCVATAAVLSYLYGTSFNEVKASRNAN